MTQWLSNANSNWANHGTTHKTVYTMHQPLNTHTRTLICTCCYFCLKIRTTPRKGTTFKSFLFLVFGRRVRDLAAGVNESDGLPRAAGVPATHARGCLAAVPRCTPLSPCRRPPPGSPRALVSGFRALPKHPEPSRTARDKGWKFCGLKKLVDLRRVGLRGDGNAVKPGRVEPNKTDFFLLICSSKKNRQMHHCICLLFICLKKEGKKLPTTRYNLMR